MIYKYRLISFSGATMDNNHIVPVESNQVSWRDGLTTRSWFSIITTCHESNRQSLSCFQVCAVFVVYVQEGVIRGYVSGVCLWSRLSRLQTVFGRTGKRRRRAFREANILAFRHRTERNERNERNETKEGSSEFIMLNL